MSGFREPPIPRDQLALWAQRLDDALPQTHPARLLDELFDSAALRPLFSRWEARYDLTKGKPPYHPRILAMLYVFGMLHGIRSTRQLEAACHCRIDVMWLMSGLAPDHSTIAAFLIDHKTKVAGLLRDVVRVGIRAGLVKMEHQAVDGTAVEASAGRGSVKKDDRLRAEAEALEARIAELESRFESNERREGLLADAEGSWGEDAVPARDLALLKDKRRRMAEALAAIARRRQEPRSNADDEPLPIASATDPDCRVMKDKEGRRKPNYNAQTVVDTGAGMVVAAAVNDRPNDLGQLVPMLRRAEETCGRLPAEVSADSGYNTGADLAALESIKTTAYVADKGNPIKTDEARAAVAAVKEGRTLSLEQAGALPRDKAGYFHIRGFAYDAASDRLRCPGGALLEKAGVGHRQTRSGISERTRYRTGACGSCALAKGCCRNPAAGRTVTRDQFEGQRERMRERLATEEGRARYRLRGQTIEPRIGTVKTVLGLRKFLRRGVEKVRLEFELACTALNVKVLLNHWEEVKAAIG